MIETAVLGLFLLAMLSLALGLWGLKAQIRYLANARDIERRRG